MTVDRDNFDRVFCYYLTSSNTIRFGLFSGVSGEPIFAREMVLDPDYNEARGRFSLGSVSTVMQDLRTQIRILALDVAGNVIFDKEYNSPFFGRSPGRPDLDPDQNTGLDRLPDGSGFLLIVDSSVEISSSLVPIFSYSWVVARLDNGGGVVWSKRFELVTPESNTISDEVMAADGSVTITIAGTEMRQTWVVKLTPDGSLAWATVLENAEFFDLVLAPDSTPFLAGTGSLDQQQQVPFEIVRLNRNTGNLEAQVGLKASDLTLGNLAGASSERLYWVAETFDHGLSVDSTNLVGFVSFNLDQPFARRYREPLGFTARGRYDDGAESLIYTFDSAPFGSVGVVALNENLAAPGDCDPFHDAAMRVSNPGITQNAFNIALVEGSITVTNISSVIAPIHFAVSPYDLSRTNLCSNPAPKRPNLAIVPNPSSATNRYSLSFDSELGVNYEVQFSVTVQGTFSTIETAPGTGGRLRFEIKSGLHPHGFFVVRATKP
jgi:hypothetical protein